VRNVWILAILSGENHRVSVTSGQLGIGARDGDFLREISEWNHGGIVVSDQLRRMDGSMVLRKN
jgi:hypothetical protein